MVGDLPEGGRPFFISEVIDQGGEPIKVQEYFDSGMVTEFRYGIKVTTFTSWQLSVFNYPFLFNSWQADRMLL